MKRLIETNSFDAYRTAEGIVIHQKNKATLKMGLLTIAISISAYLLAIYIPAEKLPKKWMEWLIDPLLYYVSIIAGITGIVFIVRSILFKKPKPILFNKHTKELHRRFEKIPFREIENLHLVSFPFIGGSIANIKFKHKGLTRTLMPTPSSVKNTSEIYIFVNELSEMVKKSGY